MRILIDIGHPAHVHLFKCFAHEMESNGHKVLFTCREKEFEKILLESEELPYVSFGEKYSSMFGKMVGLVKFTILELWTAMKFHPDVFISHGSMYAAIASFLYQKPHISFEDTYNFEQIKLYLPFTNIILTGDYEHPYISDKEIQYAGYHELAYLHPSRFTPDPMVLNELGLNPEEKFVLIRFVSWNATHDVGHKGISLENKYRAVNELSKYAKVYISSEDNLPADMERYRIMIEPNRMHHVLAFASLVFGESATMVSEGVVLGTPGIYIDNTGRYYTTEEQTKYDMCYCYSESLPDQELAINKAIELIRRDDLKTIWAEKRSVLLAEKIDVTGFLVNLVNERIANKNTIQQP